MINLWIRIGCLFGFFSIMYSTYYKRLYLNLLFSYINYYFRSKDTSLTICPSRKAVCITYSKQGQSHNIYVPYNSRQIAKMSGHRAFLIKSEQETEITQQPGIPYLVTAEQLGGEQIKIVTLDETKYFDKAETVKF